MNNRPMPSADAPVVAARRQRLERWIADHFGGEQVAFNRSLPEADRINQGQLSGMISGAKAFGEKVAARLEAVAGMPAGYLVKALDPVGASQPVGLDLDTLRVALIALREAADAEEKEIDLYKSAPIIAFAYRERASMKVKPTPAQLAEFDQAIRKRLREGQGNGEWTGRATGDGAGSVQGDAPQAAKARRGKG